MTVPGRGEKSLRVVSPDLPRKDLRISGISSAASSRAFCKLPREEPAHDRGPLERLLVLIRPIEVRQHGARD